MYSLSAISVRWGLNDEGITFSTKAGSFYALVWHHVSFYFHHFPLVLRVLTSRMRFNKQIFNLPLCRLLKTVNYGGLCGPHVISTRRFKQLHRMDLLYDLHNLRASRSPQEERLMSGDEVGWFHTCIILFWKPNKEAWLERIYVVRKITFAGQN